jgi:glycosyltransferase involved in cell wall biosynthesis
MRPKIIRISTIALSLNVLLKGQLAFLQKYYNVIAVSGDDKDLRLVENREGVKTQNITMQRQIAPLKDIISLIKLYFLFIKEKPQIVHSITPKAGLLSMIAAYLARVPIRIHTFTGLIFPTRSGVMQRLLIIMDKILCSCATNIYPEGEGVKKDLISYKITKKPLKVLENGNINGIDTNFFDSNLFSLSDNSKLKQELDIQSNEFVFLFVGRIVGDKGINELVAAFEKLISENKNIKLLLVGPFEEELDPLSDKTTLIIKQNKQIISVGYQNDVRPYFAIANVLVFPSYREGFPNVVMQAGAMGLPSIVTNINGCNEIIVNGENGIIIPVKNISALKKEMRRLFEDTSLLLKLKYNSRPYIIDRYSQDLVWRAILDEYKKILNDR